jgi:hypothetical protein
MGERSSIVPVRQRLVMATKRMVVCGVAHGNSTLFFVPFRPNNPWPLVLLGLIDCCVGSLLLYAKSVDVIE